MKAWIVASLLAVACLAVYWPHPDAQFVLDDYYTVARNPLIKNPSLYKNIWNSRLFDAHQSSGYIKFGYYRPVLQSSWILDYRLFGLKAAGFQWMNLLIHGINCFLIYILLQQLFGQSALALKASLLFCVLPIQEWVVRYVTGRGDELSALFGFLSLLCLVRFVRDKRSISVIASPKGEAISAFLFLALAALTREAAISYILYGFLIYYFLKNDVIPVNNNVIPAKAGIHIQNINRFSLYWILIGILPLVVIWRIIPNLGNILALHIFYFASVGLCLWMAQLRLRWVMLLFALFAGTSFYQGQFWTTEETLLRHTRSLEWWPRTVFAQQLLMKYDDDIPGINDMIASNQDPIIKAMWLRRLGLVYFKRGDLAGAQQYFTKSLSLNACDVDSLDALAVVFHYKGQEAQSLEVLKRSLAVNPSYPDTLRTLGVYYYNQKDLAQARFFLNRCLYYDPNQPQCRELLRMSG